MKTITNLITAIILLCTLNIFAQPKPFDYKNARENHNKLMSDTKSKEAEHYREYVEKYKNAGLPMNDNGWSWEQIFYYYRINLDALEEFKALGIDLVKHGKGKSWYRAFSEMDYLDKTLFSNILFIGEAVDSCAVGDLSSKYHTKFTIKVTEVLKGKELYEDFPDTINLYFEDYPVMEKYRKWLNSPIVSEKMKNIYRKRIKGKTNLGMYGVGDLGIKLGKKCIVYLEDSYLPKSVTGSDAMNNYHPGFNYWFDDENVPFRANSHMFKKNINYLKRKIKKINDFNQSEFNHSSRGK